MIRDELICPKSCAAHGEMNERVGEEEEEVFLLLLFNYRSVTHVILFSVDASPAATSLNTLNTERRRQSVWHANKKR